MIDYFGHGKRYEAKAGRLGATILGIAAAAGGLLVTVAWLAGAFRPVTP